MLIGLVAVTTLVVRELIALTGTSDESGEIDGRVALDDGPELRLVPDELSFVTCMGLNNQMLALIQGTMFGLLSGLSVRLPSRVPADGTVRMHATAPTAESLSSLQLGELFDADSFIVAANAAWARYCAAPDAALECDARMRGARVRLGPRAHDPCANPDAPECRACDIKLLGLDLSPHKWPSLETTLASQTIVCAPDRALVIDSAHGDSHAGTPPSPPVLVRPRATMLRGDCPFFATRVSESLEPSAFSLFWDIFHALAAPRSLRPLVAAMRESLRTAGFESAARARAAALGFAGTEPGKADSASDAPARASRPRFNALHLRIERDWIEFCPAVKHANCLRNSFQLVNVLASEGISPALPWYVASGLTRGELLALDAPAAVQLDANDTDGAAALASRPGGVRWFRRLAASFVLVFKDDLVDAAAYAALPRSRELHAMVDLTVIRASQTFVANPHSSLAALEFVSRQVKGRASRAIAYNGNFFEISSRFAPTEPVHRPSLARRVKLIMAFPLLGEMCATVADDSLATADDTPDGGLASGYCGAKADGELAQISAGAPAAVTDSDVAGRLASIKQTAKALAKHAPAVDLVVIFGGAPEHPAACVLRSLGVRVVAHPQVAWLGALGAALADGLLASEHATPAAEALMLADVPTIGLIDDFVLSAHVRADGGIAGGPLTSQPVDWELVFDGADYDWRGTDYAFPQQLALAGPGRVGPPSTVAFCRGLGSTVVVWNLREMRGAKADQLRAFVLAGAAVASLDGPERDDLLAQAFDGNHGLISSRACRAR